MRLATQLGPTAVPLLIRKLRCDDDREASWAYFLLSRLGGERTVSAARDLVQDDTLPDAKKALVLALLAELGAALPESIRLRDPNGLRDQSVRQLVASLVSPAEIARAADLLLEQVLPDELATFVDEMADVAGPDLGPLVAELLLRDDLPAAAREPLIGLRDRLGPPARVRPHPPATRRTVRIGADSDGRRALFITEPRRGTTRRRAFTAIVDASGRLARATHDDDAPAAAIRRLAASLASQGFDLEPATPLAAHHLLAGAARATRGARTRLPRPYYLGRDLCDIWNEHEAPSPDLLDQAMSLLTSGAVHRARVLLDRHVETWPDDAEGRSCLATCLLEVDEPEAALRHFAIAARLEPDDPIRYWNLAHAAKKLGKLGGAYLALLDYLKRSDSDDGAASRIRSARRYVRLFERWAKLEHPQATPLNVARGEELFDRGFAHLQAGRPADAITSFEAVLKLVPSHYPSWGNLGAAYVQLRRPEDAERCLLKALEYRPDYEVAHKNLLALRD